MARYSACWPDYARRWDSMIITRPVVIERAAKFALDHRGRYDAVERMTGVPWVLTAIMHRRESDGDFNTYLGNGEPLNRVTRLVPKGRGPFASWEEGALDALDLDGVSRWKDWRLEKIIYAWELLNGFGYRSRGLPSPYIWAATNQQVPGKFVADGHFDPEAVDKQPGCCGILRRVLELGEITAAPWLERET